MKLRLHVGVWFGFLAGGFIVTLFLRCHDIGTPTTRRKHYGNRRQTNTRDNASTRAARRAGKYEEEDGTSSYQKFTLIKISKSEIGFSRAFSDDGEHYHFELKGVYRRKG